MSLQKGRPAPESFPVRDPAEPIADFADNAGLIANLDLVISVDTAVAHLAATILPGTPAWARVLRRVVQQLEVDGAILET